MKTNHLPIMRLGTSSHYLLNMSTFLPNFKRSFFTLSLFLLSYSNPGLLPNQHTCYTNSDICYFNFFLWVNYLFNVIDIQCYSNFSNIRIRKWKFNHMQTIASTLVVQKRGYTNSIVMYIIRWQVHSTICNIISFNADFLSMKGLKSICTIRDC